MSVSRTENAERRCLRFLETMFLDLCAAMREERVAVHLAPLYGNTVTLASLSRTYPLYRTGGISFCEKMCIGIYCMYPNG